MTNVTSRLTAKDRDQLRNPTLGNRVWATFFYMGEVWFLGLWGLILLPLSGEGNRVALASPTGSRPREGRGDEHTAYTPHGARHTLPYYNTIAGALACRQVADIMRRSSLASRQLRTTDITRSHGSARVL